MESDSFGEAYGDLNKREVSTLQKVKEMQDNVFNNGGNIDHLIDIEEVVSSAASLCGEEDAEYYQCIDLELFLKKSLSAHPEPRVVRVIDLAKKLCNGLGVSDRAFLDVMIMSIIHLIKGDKLQAQALIKATLSHMVGVLMLSEAAREIGKSGGRPEHKRKTEAIELAKKRWEQMPRASLSSVATYVKSKLESKYTDAPKLPSIKAWLNKSNLKQEPKLE
ncbi:hypothetical protein [Serratia proteamaculans]|uniref:hypothetical protein n=1 Tax=Serratia proteamaculans TaxID=28151 RepID=UPI0021843DC6|nr:hypothetical protein [Serratia proteamaculans]CAI2472327.1 Uncharacterised protein [Serratia proteamaculans]